MAPALSLFVSHPLPFQSWSSSFRTATSLRQPLTPSPIRRPSNPPLTCCAPSPIDLEAQFARLNHVNKNLRKKASVAISESPTPANISRLLSLLSLTDTAHRRAAVQTLGMMGSAAVTPVINCMQQSEDATVRASCAKALAAVALYFPELRQDFPDDALDALQNALMNDPDPVTKLATVGCLGTVGSDSKRREMDQVLNGNKRAVDMLLALCGVDDMAVGATAVGAVAQIAQNGNEESKSRIIQALKELAQKEGGDGFGYVQEMAKSHIEQLEGGVAVGKTVDD